MDLGDMIVAVQGAVGVTPDGDPGTETWTAIYNRLCPTTVQSIPAFVLIADGNHNDPWPPPPSIPAFIHKATEGTFFQDPQGMQRRPGFKANGGKWGWYHFTSGEDAKLQASNFIAYLNKAGYQSDDLLVLDFEESSRSGDSNMTVSAAETFISLVENYFNCKVCVYGSDMLTEALEQGAFATQPLWVAAYRSSLPSLPAGRSWAIWQYTGNGSPYSDMDRILQTNLTLWPNLPV